jgi:ubiquinone/menaquinone biosynthesis C-methylase UbiE
MTEAGNLFADGQAYERQMGRWSRLAGEAFLDWLAPPQNRHWLDVGCGNGSFTEVLIARCAPSEVMAIDPSEGQLAYARKQTGAKLAQFCVGDAQALPFGDGSFDLAAMALVITFLSDPAKAIAEMARVVRPGGWVATYMWDSQAGGMPLEPIYVAMKSLGMIAPRLPSSAASNRENMQALWERTGLMAINTCVIRIPVEFMDFDDFWESYSAPIGITGKAINAMSLNAREQLKTRLHKQLPTRPDGRIVYEAFANAVKGRAPG